MNTMPGTAIRVLVVDDDSRLCELTATYLEKVNEDITTHCETDAADALAMIDESDVDCVVSDYQMPGMDGLELLDAVRERDADLPFLLYTGRGSEEVASEAISAGVTDYLRKTAGPQQYDLLANRVENAVRRRRTASSLQRTRRTLLDERAQFAALFENTTDAIAAYELEDGAPVVRGVNPAFEETFGVASDAVTGRPLSTVVVPPETEGTVADAADLVAAGERVERRVERRTPDGARSFLLRTVPVEPGTVRSVPMAVTSEAVQGYAVYTELRDPCRVGGRPEGASSD